MNDGDDDDDDNDDTPLCLFIQTDVYTHWSTDLVMVSVRLVTCDNEVMFSPALVSLLVNKITQKLFNIFPQNSAERWLVGYRRNHQILVLIRIT